MIKITTKSEIEKIVEYIGDHYKSTPYLYVNIIKYGLGTNNVTAWIDYSSNGSIEGVYLLYYDCIHFYTNETDNYSVDKLIDFIRRTKHRVVMLQGAIGDRIDNELHGYESERNHVIEMDRVGLNAREYLSEIAIRDDILQIVDLLMADPEYTSVYDREVLSDQLYDRYDSNFSRYFVVKMDGKVVATCSTYGEVPGFALVGGVIVHPDYRRRGLAADVENYACNVLASEGISKVGFVNYNNSASLALHEKLGAFSIATLAKYIKVG
jgi:N-acetylglutamate synthase-like GNAT family acetyltransferase